MEVARDIFILAVAGGGLLLALALALGWIELGLLGWILLIGAGVAAFAVQIMLGLLSSLADLLACRRG